MYPSGKVGIKPHRDREIGEDIAGISLGVTRSLCISNRTNSKTFLIPNGSLYLIKQPTNKYFNPNRRHIITKNQYNIQNIIKNKILCLQEHKNHLWDGQ